MKHPVLALLGLLAVAAAPVAQAVEILRWERMPLAVPLKVGQERIVFIDRNVRVGVPAGVGKRLRVQSAGGAVYLRASEPIEPTRLQLQDADTGALILLDIAAEPPKDGEAELEPVRIVEGDSAPGRYGEQADSAEARHAPRARQVRGRAARNSGPCRADALRRAEPLRTAAHRRAASGRHAGQPSRDLDLDTLMPTLPVRAAVLASWRLGDQWVTAVRLTNTGADWVALDPRVLRGDFLTATFQHEGAGPARHDRGHDRAVPGHARRGLARRCCRRFTASTLPCICRSRTATRTPRRPAMRSNGLLKWLMIPVAILVLFAGIRLFSGGGGTAPPAADNGAQLTPEGNEALGIEGDTPRDTVATLVAQVKRLRTELQTALSDNKSQREENQRLRQRELHRPAHQLGARIERSNLRRDQEQAASARQQTEGLLADLQRRLDSIGGRGGGHADLPVGLGLQGRRRTGMEGGVRWVEPDDAKPAEGRNGGVARAAA